MTGWADGLAAVHAAAVGGAVDPPPWEQVRARAARLVALLIAVEALAEHTGAGAESGSARVTISGLEAEVGGGLDPQVREDVVQLELLDVEVLGPWLDYARAVAVPQQLAMHSEGKGSQAAATGSATAFQSSADAATGLASRVGAGPGLEEGADGGFAVSDELFDAASDSSVALAGVQLARAYLSGGDLGKSATQVRQALGLHAAGRAAALLTGVEGARLAAALAATGYGLAQRQVLSAVNPSLRRTAALSFVLEALPHAPDTAAPAVP